MNRTRRKRAALVFFLLLALLIAVPVVTTWLALRQYRLNRNLIAAVKRNDDRVVVTLLNEGADANCRDEVVPAVPLWQRLLALFRGRKSKPSTAPTPLLLALKEKIPAIPFISSIEYPPENVTLIRALLEHGADINCHTEGDGSPLFLAFEDKKVATIHLLVAHGAHVNDTTHYPLLCRAVCDFPQHPDVFLDLLAHGANVNIRDDNGNTPLLYAIFSNNVAAVKILLAHHADVTIRGWHNLAPLSYARYTQYTLDDFREIIRLLKAAGAGIHR